MIDKELFRNLQVANVSKEARFLYLSMIVHADDAGRLRANAKYLRAMTWPYDADVTDRMVDKSISELTNAGLIEIYDVDGDYYLHHPNWERWQSIRKDRAKPSDCPPKTEAGKREIFFNWMNEELEEGILSPEAKEVPFWLKKKILIRDNFTCRYCLKSLYDDRKLKISVDHVLPFSKGGKTIETNLVTSCISCNCSKKERTLEESGMTLADVGQTSVRHMSDNGSQMSDNRSLNLTEPNQTKEKNESRARVNVNKRFMKPTIGEIESYARSMGWRTDAKMFFDHYESNGWRVGRVPMVDWKAAVRTWKSNEGTFSRVGNGTVKKKDAWIVAVENGSGVTLKRYGPYADPAEAEQAKWKLVQKGTDQESIKIEKTEVTA